LLIWHGGWIISEFSACSINTDGDSPTDLDPKSLAAVETFLKSEGLVETAHAAILAILYVYMTMGKHAEL
jgi:hypothetical protein